MPAAKKKEVDASEAIQAFICLTSASNGKVCTCISNRIVKKIAIRYPEILVEIHREERNRPLPDYSGSINSSRCQHIDGLIDSGQKYTAMTYLVESTGWEYDKCVKLINKRITELSKQPKKKKKPGTRKLQLGKK